MSRLVEANKIIRSHVLWAMGAGLIPIPLVDFAAVTAIQLEMLQQLARLYNVNYSQNTAKTFVSALTGTTLARIGASILKVIPGVGSIIGGASMSVMSGASTYAVGQVAINIFSGSGSFSSFDMEEVKRAYEQAYEQGKGYVSDLENREDEAANVYQALENLGKLKEQGILSEEEFQAKKKQLLDRI
ncbi:DUF697 domain-containing protein [Gloeocapsa sp. PCC 73106]|uniref:DUF697 domain-containing protein n=1 Tax=Gloeocapsa sp. PCC 73106 TaxID=102232 RepID=UPI0002AC77D1|nr:DUF697 domain-containing protein [Gloeocapsa sp. PCC 73106]ELR98181.1 uncharacterized protein associated with GTPases [Gloeocapsa sp. PCC 73106]